MASRVPVGLVNRIRTTLEQHVSSVSPTFGDVGADSITTEGLYTEDRSPDVVVKKDGPEVVANGPDGEVDRGSEPGAVIQSAIDAGPSDRVTQWAVKVKGSYYDDDDNTTGLTNQIALKDYLHLDLRGARLETANGFPDDTFLLEGLDVQFVTVRGGVLYGDQGNTNINGHGGIHITADTGPTNDFLEGWNRVYNLTVAQFDGVGYHCEARRDYYQGCLARNCNEQGYLVDDSDVTFVACTALNNDIGFHLRGAHATLYRPIAQNNDTREVDISEDGAMYNKIREGYIELGKGPGLVLGRNGSADFNQVSGVEFIANTGEAIIVHSDGNRIRENQIYDNSGSPTQTWAARITSGATDNVFEGNDVTDNPQTFDDSGTDTVFRNNPGYGDQTFIRATRGSNSSSTTANTFINAFDGESEDALDEFNSSQQFTPEQTGWYEIDALVNVAGATGAGDEIQVQVRNVTDGATVIGQTARSNGAAWKAPFSHLLELDAGDDYEIQVRNIDSDFTVLANATYGTIRRVEV